MPINAWSIEDVRAAEAAAMAQLPDGELMARAAHGLAIVLEARIQSVALHQGPAERLLGVASIEPHVVHGPVRTRLGLIDEARAVALFTQLDVEGQQARSADTSHRWAAAPAEEAPA